MIKLKNPISALLQFSELGNLQSIFLNSKGAEDEEILQKRLSKLLKPAKFNLIRALFRRIGHE